jgi:hypothetical protein
MVEIGTHPERARDERQVVVADIMDALRPG